MGAAFAYLSAIGQGRIETHNLALRNRLFAALHEVPKVRVFSASPGTHPIVPIWMSGPRAASGGDARLAHDVAAALLGEGIYVVGFSHPVVPKGASRIRVQLSAAHTADMIDQAIDAFRRVGTAFALI